MRSRCLSAFSIAMMTVLFYTPLLAETRLTILHTNDLHSHLQGFSPNRDYSPTITGNDDTMGGWARIASVIKTEKAKRDNPVLVLDSGDFLMGSLFHMVSREQAFELVLMKEMGVDMTTLGNHEFDIRPEGLARVLESAVQKGKMPQIVASNLIFDDTNIKDDRLEALFKQGVVKPYQVMVKDGLRIGFFGLMGHEAAGFSPFASPVKFSDPFETAKEMVRVLKQDEKADLIICLSHSGLNSDPEKSEDELLAQNVDGIDIIISGHTHTRLLKPIICNDTVIVQSWAYGKHIGVLDMIVSSEGVRVTKYQAIPINDAIAGDTHINDMINSCIDIVNQDVLKPYNLRFDQPLVKTDFDLKLAQEETNLGNLVTDATRWMVDQVEYDPADPGSRVDISIQSNGVIRDNILKGETGLVTVSDLFRVVPLGIGSDDTMGYPLVSIYVNAAEIKKVFEVLTTVCPLKGDDYYLQVSGAKISYNPNRMLFDRVTDIALEDGNGSYSPVKYSSENSRLYKFVTNIYNATFLKIIGGFTNGILTIVPKDRLGNPLEDLASARVDGDKSMPGIQEVKDWTALMKYVQTFKDSDGDSIPEIPELYRSNDGRVVAQASFNPYKLLAGGNYLTWIAFGGVLLVLGLIFLIIYLPVRIIRKRKNLL